jgi:hypothetical protein
VAASKTLTPEQRTERASKAARARNSLDCYVKQVVDRAPELTPEQVAKLRTILAPAGR